jgi:RNA polymerase sigma-70 factor (ECF subfamily)
LVDEVIQEAPVTVCQRFDQLRDEPGFLPWAKVIVRFKCLSAIGKLGRDRHVFCDGVLDAGAGGKRW